MNLTKQEKQEKKLYIKKLQKAEEFLKKLKEDLNRLEKYQYNDNEDQDYKGIRQIENLFNKINEEDYYKPIKTEDSNDNYTEYESRGDKDKNLSLEDYLNAIRPYLKDMINNYKANEEWERIQLLIHITFVSSLDKNKFRTMYTYSDNVKILNNETDDIINELFESIFDKYQEELEKNMRGSEFIFNSIDLLYYKLHKIRLKRGGSYIDSPRSNDKSEKYW